MVWTVAGLVQAVADALASRFSACVVRGEISSFSRAASGHCYFCIKDADGQSALIRCAMFRRAASLLDFAPADGQLVELRGRLSVYEPRGELQLVVESMQRAGAGALYEQFMRLRAKLEAEGLFDTARKRALPAFPRRVGIVTSLAAAALHDVVTSFERRAPHVELLLYPSLVQGADAPPAITAAIERANRHGMADVLLVCRGGGSMEDLWAFNDERVVRAVAASALPVVSGVGHEIDLTLCDLAADVRAPTPTAAAELVVQAREDSLAVLLALDSRIQGRMRHALDLHAQRLDASAMRLARPTRVLARQTQGLMVLQQRLSSCVHRAVERRRLALGPCEARLDAAALGTCARQRVRLASLEARLHALDPRQVLRRGYAWLTDVAGDPLQSVAQLSAGQSLRAVLADGAARVTVDEVLSDPGPLA